MCQVLFYASESISEQSNNHYPSLPSDGGNKKWIIMIKYIAGEKVIHAMEIIKVEHGMGI